VLFLVCVLIVPQAQLRIPEQGTPGPPLVFQDTVHIKALRCVYFPQFSVTSESSPVCMSELFKILSFLVPFFIYSFFQFSRGDNERSLLN
jgi:hypothetical protein